MHNTSGYALIVIDTNTNNKQNKAKTRSKETKNSNDGKKHEESDQNNASLEC